MIINEVLVQATGRAGQAAYTHIRNAFQLLSTMQDSARILFFSVWPASQERCDLVTLAFHLALVLEHQPFVLSFDFKTPHVTSNPISPLGAV